MGAITIEWEIEVTETYKVLLDDESALAEFGTLDPDEIRDQIDENWMASEEIKDHETSSNVCARNLGKIHHHGPKGG